MTAFALSMSSTDRVIEGMQRAVPKLPGDAANVLKQMLSPTNLAILAGGITFWIGSHAFGFGEFVDVLLVGVGVFTLGWSVFAGAAKLKDFLTAATFATSDDDLERAGEYFAEAITELGVGAIQAFFMRGQFARVYARGMPKYRPMPKLSTPPTSGGLQLQRPLQIPGGDLGLTDEFGRMQIPREYFDKNISSWRRTPLSLQKEALYHEIVHRYLSPKTGPLLKLRGQLKLTTYHRVAFLKYLEEVLAEGYAQFKMHGLLEAGKVYRFPINGDYLTVADLKQDGAFIGTILLAGRQYYVSLTHGKG